MREQAPLPSSATQSLTEEAPPVPPSQDQAKPKNNSRYYRYNRSEQGKTRQARYDQSPKGKAKDHRYNRSEQGKAAHERYLQRKREGKIHSQAS